MSGEIVGGMLPSAVPVQATANASAVEALATAIRLSIGFIPGYLCSRYQNWADHGTNVRTSFRMLLFQVAAIQLKRNRVNPQFT